MLKRPAADADPGLMRRRRTTLSSQEGMTLVELMVAAFVLVVGMLAVAGMLATGFRKNVANTQRVAATNLARELTEAARIATYDQLSPADVVTAVKAANANLDTDGTPWQVERRNTTFTITTTACTYDDPSDKLATPAVADRCALTTGTSTATGDQNGDDFRRVTFNVSWRENARTRTFTQTALVVNPAGGLGPRIVPPLPTLADVTTAPSPSSVSFAITTTSAASLHWNVDNGISAGDATGGPTAWTVKWDIASVPDGTYTIGLQAFSDRGIPGDARAVDVTLNRYPPVAPTGFAGGHDTRAGDWVDFEWSLNPERDVIGYRVYDAGANKTLETATDRMVCPTSAGTWLENAATTCQDTTPPPGAARYYVVALDRDTAGNVRPGTGAPLDVGAPNTRPNVPQAVTLGAGPTLNWSAPASGSATFFRVYRDGTTPADRIGKLTGTSYKDDGAVYGDPHTYYVSAVDAKFNESDLVGPLCYPVACP